MKGNIIYTKGNEKINYEDQVRNALLNARILFSVICVRGEDNVLSEIEKGFFGFDLPREKLFTYPWESVDIKVDHQEQKVKNIFY